MYKRNVTKKMINNTKNENITTIFKEKTLQKMLQYMLPIAIVLLSIVFGVLNPKYFSFVNMTNVARQAAVLSIVAVGETIVIISGNIDLSVGSIIGLISIVGAMAICQYGFFLGFIICMLVCMVIGLVHGVIITRYKIPAFIATLGALTFWRGLTFVISNGMPVGGLLENNSFLALGNGNFLKLPIPLFVAIITLILGYLFLTYSVTGRKIYAVGGNSEASLLSGINVNNTIIYAYVVATIMSGIAALVLTSRISIGLPTLGKGYELQAIAATIIGGASFKGGSGSMTGTLLGVIIVSIIGNGLNLLRVSSFVQLMVNGAIIVLAVGLDKIKRGNN